MADESGGAWLSDFGTKVSDLEEKHNLLRDRVLMADEGFIKSLDLIKKELTIVKDSLREIKRDIESVKETSQSIIDELNNFARKEELQVLERYMKLWEPLKFVKADEVRKIIREETKVKKEEKEE
ncbi:hypothetical protein HZA33_03825 [Candidatus Pacearchaeota archaeon]|nr:hypothetical protein [Candidatus Pacearchaeota archaeon]